MEALLIDFDSTFVQVEALEELGKLSLADSCCSQKLLDDLAQVTRLSMEGKLSYAESLATRFRQLQIRREHVEQLIPLLRERISLSFLRNRRFLQEHAKQIYIISGGFKDFIWPVVESFGLLEDHVFANTFFYDYKGNVVGYDRENPLAHDNGKAQVVASLNLGGEGIVLGDGMTDYEIRAQGQAKAFFAFTENVKRPPVMEKADRVVEGFDEVLAFLGIPSSLLPSTTVQTKALLLENIHPDAVAFLERHGIAVEHLSKSLSEEELKERLHDISILGVRSKTTIRAELLQHAPQLIAVGAFCIGVNHIDCQACLERGIPVFNAPYSNTRSVVELAIGEMIMLLRRVVAKHEKMRQGQWDKTNAGAVEVRGKSLGIVGYGKIGSQLSVVAEALGMKVYYYDLEERLPMGNAEKCSSLESLLELSDVVSLHVDGRGSNASLLGYHELTRMKKGAVLINLSRGTIVDMDALRRVLEEGHLAGVALDVFPQEPKETEASFVAPLKGIENVLLTPHIGGNTLEAQKKIGKFVATNLVGYLENGSTSASVNFPNIRLPKTQGSHRILHVHANMPGMVAKINQVFAEHGINIDGQYLKTNENVGYVILDVNVPYTDGLYQDLCAIHDTIRVRRID